FKEKSRPLDGIISLASTAVGGASAFALSFAFYISKLQGVFPSGWSTVLKDVVGKHTKDIPEDMLWNGKNAISMTRTNVITQFLNMQAFTIFGLRVSYLDMFVVIAAVDILLIALGRAKVICLSYMRQQMSMFYAFLISLLAPLSWFLIAPHHAYNHQHLAYILWVYTLFVFWYLFFAVFGKSSCCCKHSAPPFFKR
ncbi:MAG: hypothetical protein ACK5JF_06845, partial [Oscillospiraceae bacterium]